MGSNVKVKNTGGLTGLMHTLTSSKDFVVHLYVLEGSTFAPTRRKEEIEVTRVNRILETDDLIQFYYFDSLVGSFNKSNLIAYVAK